MAEAGTTGAPPITITTRYLAPKTPGLPALVLQVTQLVDSYMVWVGISDGGPEVKERTAAQGQLCRDWAVAMPPRPVSAWLERWSPNLTPLLW